jgi:O-antigen ligase
MSAPRPTVITHRTPWFLFLFIAACFFIIGHDFTAAEKFASMFGGMTSLEEAGEGQGESQGFRQLGGLALGAYGAMALFLSYKRPLRIDNALAALMIFFPLWAAASVLWAVEPGQTLRRVILLCFLCFGALAAARKMSLDDALLFLLLCPLLYLAIGMLTEIALGTFSPIPVDYRFAGTLHPNSQAVNCALLLLAALAWLRVPGTANHTWSIAVLLVAAYFLLLAGSRTALGSTAAAVGIWLSFSLRGPAKFFLIVLLCTAYTAFLLFGDAAMRLFENTVELGRADTEDTLGTLSGRLPLWTQLYAFILERPFLGYGYGGFWTPDHIQSVMNEQGWPLSHAHNAYIDMVLELGPLGGLSYLLILLLGMRRAFVLQRLTHSPVYSCFGMILLFALLNGLMESAAIQRTQFSFFLLLILILLAFPKPEEQSPTVREQPDDAQKIEPRLQLVTDTASPRPAP